MKNPISLKFVLILGLIFAVALMMAGCENKPTVSPTPSSEIYEPDESAEPTQPDSSAVIFSDENQSSNDYTDLTDEYLISLVYGPECALRGDKQFIFDDPNELEVDQLFILFLLLTDDAILNEHWNPDEEIFCFTSDVICTQLQKYFKQVTFDIADHEKYDKSKNAIVTLTASGFGGDRNMKLAHKEINGDVVSFVVDFFADFDMQGAAYQRKTYTVEFYEGGYYFLSATIQ